MDKIPNERSTPQKKTKRKHLFSRRKSRISDEDAEIIASLGKVTRELLFAHESFELASSDILIDSFIFEILSLNKRYEYYIKLCRERGLVAEGMKS